MPGHHVEYCRLAPAQPAAIEDCPRVQDLNPEGFNPIDGFICKLPLVLVGAPALNSLEGGDAHDEVIDKLDGNGKKPSIDIGYPFRIHYKVLL